MRFRDMNDFRDLISQISIGSMYESLSKIPGMDPVGLDMPWVFDLFVSMCKSNS